MDPLLDAKLVEDFPLLYRERHWNMQQTCMCWGFACGNGWHDLIRELSAKLEAAIQKYLDDHPDGRCECGCTLEAHTHLGNRPCTTVHETQYVATKAYGYPIPQLWRDLTVSFPKNKRYALKNWWRNYRRMVRVKVGRLINKWILKPLFNWRIAVKQIPCGCQEYHQDHPRTSQVKEKFGTLSFYMSTGTEEIWELIYVAEKESAVTCEDCGKHGELRGGGWLTTLCDQCAKEQGKDTTHKKWVEEQEKSGAQLHTIMSIAPQKQADD